MLNIFDIQRGSFHDGPGIRTVVFLKGCSMSCFWCQNPESQDMRVEILDYQNLCKGCEQCINVCAMNCYSIQNGTRTYDRSKCIQCGRCAEVCYSGALQKSGQIMKIEDILRIVLSDMDMYRISGGGLTLSGGEPLLQSTGCAKLLKMAKEYELHTAVETAGNVPWEAYDRVLPYLDLVFFDVKSMNEKMHKKACGCSAEQIQSNLERLQEKNKSIVVRTPVIPGFNDTEADIGAIAEFLSERNILSYELLPFHKLGGNKYKALGRVYQAEELISPCGEKMKRLKAVARSFGVTVK